MGTFLYISSVLVVLYIVTDHTSAESMVALLGGNASFECWLEPHVIHVVWKQGNREILVHHNLKETTIRTEDNVNWHSYINLNQMKSTLLTKHVKFNSSGSYSCNQYFERGSTKVSRYALHVQGYPYLSTEPKIFKENDTTLATCCVDATANTSDITMAWFLRDDPISPTTTTRQKGLLDGLVKFCTNDLHIVTSRYIHGRNLSCLTVSTINVSSSVVLNVLYPATVRIRTETSVNIFNRDCTLIIACESDGNPKPEVKLLKKIPDGYWENLNNETGVVSKFGDKITLVFHLNNRCRDVSGNYKCLATNKIQEKLFSDGVEVVYEFPWMNYSTALLILVSPIMVVCVLMKIFHKRRQTQYDYFLETTRRHRQRLANNFRSLTRSLRREDYSVNLPESSQKPTTHYKLSEKENNEEGYKLPYAKSIREKDGTLTLPRNMETCTLESVPKYYTLK